VLLEQGRPGGIEVGGGRARVGRQVAIAVPVFDLTEAGILVGRVAGRDGVRLLLLGFRREGLAALAKVVLVLPGQSNGRRCWR
jgi:hypothetical protein